MSVGGVSHSPDSGEQSLQHVVATATAAGATVVYTPAGGKRVRLRWAYAVNDPNAATTPLISIFLGAEEKYRVYALSKRQLVEGPVDGALSVALNIPGSVALTFLLEEI